MRKLAGICSVLALLLLAPAGAPASVSTAALPTRIVDYETIFASLEPDGSVRTVRLIDNLRVFGGGDFEVTDPMATNDFRNLSGFARPDLGNRQAKWSIAGLDGSREFVSAGTPELRPPLGLQVTYKLNGKRVEGRDLVGSTGPIELAFKVSNNTAKPMEISYKDGSGAEQKVKEEVPIPMVAELSFKLPRRHFSKVEAPGADIITDARGDLTVAWSMVMVPPIGELVQLFSLRADADDARFGRIQLAGASIAPKERPYLSFAEKEFAEGSKKAGSLYSGSTALGSNLDNLHDGVLTLLDGMQQLLAGSEKLSSGLKDASAGSGKITGGLASLNSGLTKILDGLKSLGERLPAARDGAAKIKTAALGIQQITAGLAACLTGSGTPCSGNNPSISAIAGRIKTGADALVGPLAPYCVGPCINIAISIGQGAGGIQAIAAGLAACLTGSGTPCSGNPSISAIAGLIAIGAQQLVDGIAAAIAGVNTLIGGVATASGGANQLLEGSSKLTGGLKEAASGSGRLSAGIESAEGGTSQIEQGTYSINELGVKEIARSATAAAGDLARQLALLEAQDKRAEEPLAYGPPASDQADEVVGASGVVLVLDALDGRNAASVVRAVIAGVGALLLLGLGLLGMRRLRAA